MFLYTVLTALAGAVAGILLAARTKKAPDVIYGRLDKAGKLTNLILLCIYGCLSPFFMFVGMISAPAHDGFMGLVGWIVSLVIASATMLCGLGLGASVALRKQGRSKLSFGVQFLGVVAMVLAGVLFATLYGGLLRTLN